MPSLALSVASRRLRRFVALCRMPSPRGAANIRVCPAAIAQSQRQNAQRQAMLPPNKPIAAEQAPSQLTRQLVTQSLSGPLVTNSIWPLLLGSAMRIARNGEATVTCLCSARHCDPELPPCTHRWCASRGVQAPTAADAGLQAARIIHHLWDGMHPTGAGHPHRHTNTVARWRQPTQDP